MLFINICYYRINGEDVFLVECYMKYNILKWFLKVDEFGLSLDIYFDVIIFINFVSRKINFLNIEFLICISRYV